MRDHATYPLTSFDISVVENFSEHSTTPNLGWMTTSNVMWRSCSCAAARPCAEKWRPKRDDERRAREECRRTNFSPKLYFGREEYRFRDPKTTTRPPHPMPKRFVTLFEIMVHGGAGGHRCWFGPLLAWIFENLWIFCRLFCCYVSNCCIYS